MSPKRREHDAAPLRFFTIPEPLTAPIVIAAFLPCDRRDRVAFVYLTTSASSEPYQGFTQALDYHDASLTFETHRSVTHPKRKADPMSLARIHAHALHALAALSTLRDPARSHARAVSTLTGSALSVDFSAALSASLDVYTSEEEPATVREPFAASVSLVSEVCS